jgi:pilus assembly protein CpaB
MSKMRILMFGLAAFSAIGAGVLAKGLIGKREVRTNTVVVDEIPKEAVLVVAKDVFMGDKMGEGVLVWEEWPTKQVQPSMITKKVRENAIEELRDARARYAMFQGEVVVEKKLVLPGDKGFMSAILPKGMRAVSVGVSVNTTAGGFILPNDRVDVILTRKFDNNTSANGGQPYVVSKTVLTNVRVLAINQTYRQEAEGNGATVAEGKTATLELTAEQSVVMANVEAAGELSLALRSIAESDGRKLDDEKPVLSEDFKKGAPKSAAVGITYIKSGIKSVTQSAP